MRTTAVLTYVGRREYDYDFEGRDGQRIRGTKRFAYFADPDSHIVQEVEVKDDLAEVLASLSFTGNYEVTVEPAARQNRVVYVLRGIA